MSTKKRNCPGRPVFRMAPGLLLILAVLMSPLMLHEVHAQRHLNILDLVVGGTTHVQGQLDDAEFAESHIFLLDGWTDIDIQLDGADEDVSMLLWHLSTDEQIAAPGDYVLVDLKAVDRSAETGPLTLRAGRYAIVVAGPTRGKDTYTLAITTARGKRPSAPVVVDLGVIDGDHSIVSDWMEAEERERHYLITTVEAVQLAVFLASYDGSASLAVHEADTGALLGGASASEAASGEILSSVERGTYRLSVSASGKRDYDLTIFAVPE